MLISTKQNKSYLISISLFNRLNVVFHLLLLQYGTGYLLYGPHHVKTCLWAYANSKDPDQPVHTDQGLHCLLKDSLDITECMNGEQSPAWYYTHTQDDLNLHILPMFEGTFSLNAAHIYFKYMDSDAWGNSVDSDQTAPKGIAWSGSVSFVMHPSILTLVLLNKLRYHTLFKFSASQITWSRLLI